MSWTRVFRGTTDCRSRFREARITDSEEWTPPLSRDERRREPIMDVVYERSCGLDIHKKTVVACLILHLERGAPKQESPLLTRQFSQD